jgi:hypothetical protein
MRINTEAEIAEDLGTNAIAQPYMLEPNHGSEDG